MKKDYSRTAEGMALIRAMEQSVPVPGRIIDDPYAKDLVQHWYLRLIARFPLISRAVLAFFDRWAPGGQEFLTIRARLSDDEVIAFVRSGGQQIVLLGAGFESLVLRLRETLSPVSVFEIDHPATQKVKLESLRDLPSPSVHFIPVDFESDNFAERLIESGFDRDRRSLIIWVGVTFYLTPQAVQQTFAAIGSLLGKGSRVLVDFLDVDVAHGTSVNRDALEKARRVALLGEPWIFGVAPNKVGEFVQQFGFDLVKLYDADELWARYAPERKRPIDYVMIAACEKN